MKRATQALCVSRRMAAGVVVEVGEHGTAFAQPQVYPICPAVQRSVVVAAAVSLRTMKTHVDKRTDFESTRGRSAHVVQAQRDSMPLQ